MKRSAEVESVVRRFLKARVGMDMEAMGSLHSDSEDLRLISSADKWFKGQEAVLPAGGSVGDPEDWVVTDSKILRLEGFEDGPVGWAAAEQERTFVGGQTVVLRMTAVLRLESAVWRVVQLHFSTAVPDDTILTPVELPRTLSDLLDALDSERGRQPISGAGLATATVMFTDVVDSTAISKGLGDRRWSEIISEHFRSVQAIVERHAGVQVKTLGDGGMYLFPSATGALSSAIEVQKLVETGTDRIALRIGLHTGDLISDQGDVVGLTVNKAARIAALASGGQVLVSTTITDLVGPNEFTFDPPIRAELKGLDGTHTLHQLNWS
ncbi:MAG: adenylate/guanylate cyclase domain-containing protein [Acidimicrobiia bacterium]|nr:adenylate/guanylate cyclase domain-containing protein [Acidimicrobiia bacterium]